ncbi:hypothetical protein EI171_00235 (plasmid) [Bradyrhizobium sp. LCT2]|nr:hypothetical protein EI171_00235 [Bradyrhizobium sp. LCT2]
MSRSSLSYPPTATSTPESVLQRLPIGNDLPQVWLPSLLQLPNQVPRAVHDKRAGPGCLDSAPLDLSGFLPGYAERGALRFCRCVGRA